MIVDVDRLPRPERSGLIAILIAYVLLTGISNVESSSWPGKVELRGWRAAICYLAPCSFLPGFYRKETESAETIFRPVRWVTRLPVSGYLEASGARLKLGHIDTERADGTIVHHHFTREFVCADVFPDDNFVSNMVMLKDIGPTPVKPDSLVYGYAGYYGITGGDGEIVKIEAGDVLIGYHCE